jgi:APA family basic amino acid/polyamine antiporter
LGAVSSAGLSRVLTRRDVLALAFGAMIGWGWVLLTGEWIGRAGSLGAVLAFVVAGGVMLVVALLYAELAAAMPQVGGEHAWSLRALGRGGSFACTWAIVFVYVSVCCFEAVALAVALEYLGFDLEHGFLWTVAGYDVHLAWALVGIVTSLLLTAVNIVGVKVSAVVQVVVTLMIVASGLALVAGAGIDGSVERVEPLFAAGVVGVLGVMTMVPFFFVGFDVIPQIAEEVDLPARELGTLTIVSVCAAILWYCLVIAAVALLADDALLAGSRAVTADAAASALGSTGAMIIVIGGIAGIVTSWNAFIVGGSRAIFAMAQSDMLPGFLGRLHPRYRTPHVAIALIGLLGCAAPLLGHKALVWLVNAGSFGAVVAYLLVAVSYVRLRHREPGMPRPFRLRRGLVIGWLGVACCLGLGALYLPGSPSALSPLEWSIFLGWIGCGGLLYLVRRSSA